MHWQKDDQEAADTDKEFEMTPAARRSIIVHQMIGERPAMRELFSELVNTKNKDLYHGGPDKGLAAVIRRIFEFCKPYEKMWAAKLSQE